MVSQSIFLKRARMGGSSSQRFVNPEGNKVRHEYCGSSLERGSLKLPNLSTQEAEKVEGVLAEGSSDQVHSIQINSFFWWPKLLRYFLIVFTRSWSWWSPGSRLMEIFFGPKIKFQQGSCEQGELLYSSIPYWSNSFLFLFFKIYIWISANTITPMDQAFFDLVDWDMISVACIYGYYLESKIPPTSF